MVELIKSINKININYSVCVTIGTMDGVHSGHKMILDKMKEICKDNHCKTVLITFHPHPRKVIRKNNIELITQFEEKLSLFNFFGMPDYIVSLEFTKELASMSPTRFLEMLLSIFDIKCFVVGYDNHFGKNREGNFELLENFSKKHKISIYKVDAYKIGDRTVSSTFIRELIKKGNLQEANKMLGYDFFVTGEVIKGKGLGKTIGFPTVNLKIDKDKILPKSGVYAGYVYLSEKYYPAAINIGFAPTIANEANQNISFEAYILGYKADLYGKKLRFHIINRIRDEKKFSSRKELSEVIKNDVKKTKEIFLLHKQKKYYSFF